MARKRPPTMKEIRKAKEPKSKYTVTVHNCGKQVVAVQCKPPQGVDFFVGEVAVRVYPGKTAKLDKSRVRMSQITNLQKKGLLRLISDTEKIKKA